MNRWKTALGVSLIAGLTPVWVWLFLGARGHEFPSWVQIIVTVLYHASLIAVAIGNASRGPWRAGMMLAAFLALLACLSDLLFFQGLGWLKYFSDEVVYFKFNYVLTPFALMLVWIGLLSRAHVRGRVKTLQQVTIYSLWILGCLPITVLLQDLFGGLNFYS